MLESQIELITVPQEFTRLCNAVLEAEHGTDFLPIDDDRPDRGNDGYLKSEKRMFAAHCFKRVQNQKLDREIRGKMVSDLGKAIALKEQGLWEVEAWTFLTNYPVSEETGRTVLKMGETSGIDVSWDGPNFLARGLQRNPEIRTRFPFLQVNSLSEQIEELREVIDGSAPEDSPVSEISRVPRSTQERDALLRLQPPGWEYLLFATTLYLGKESLERKWHDHEMPPHRTSQPAPSGITPTAYLSKQINELAGIVQGAMRVFSPDKQELAFGASGEPGDPIRIEYFADRIIESYEAILDWAMGIREFDPPGYLIEVCQVVPRMADLPLQQFREFIDNVVRETDRVPGFVANSDPNKDKLVIELDLTLSIDDGVQEEFSQKLKDAERLAAREATEG